MPEKENPIDRAWTLQFLIPLYAFAILLLIFMIGALFAKVFDLWLLIGIIALIVIFYLAKLAKRIKNGFYYIFDTNKLIVKPFGCKENSIPYREIKLVVLTGNYYFFHFSRLYRITLELGAGDEQEPSNELYNVLSRQPAPIGKFTIADFPGFMLGAFHIPAIGEENVKIFLGKLLAACKDTPPRVEGYFLSNYLNNYLNSVMERSNPS